LAKRSRGAADAAAAAADAVAADAAGEAAGAVAAVAAAAGLGAFAGPARSERLPTTLTKPTTDGRVLLDPASFCSMDAVAGEDCKSAPWIVAVPTAATWRRNRFNMKRLRL